MQHFSLEELHGTQVHQAVLRFCLDFCTRWQHTDAAVMGTQSGAVIASPEAWRNHHLALTNLNCVMSQHGITQKTQGIAAAATIRTLLHDADSSQQHGPQEHAQVLARTQAQQALEDIVQEGVLIQASDIHLQFFPSYATLSYRVDGRLVKQVRRSREILSAAIAAALNTHSDDFHEVFDERRLSSASISLSLQQAQGVQQVRLRTQKSPTREGFAVTMRIQKEQQALRLEDLGLPAAVIAALRLCLERPAGIILVVGPTGQGKTSTLAGINLSIPPDLKVISLEDPIEIIQPQIEQKPVLADHPEFNFGNMVKVALREDPDVISVSEIRDERTAKAAYTAALTGHLVTATLHAYDGFGALQRLRDLGLSLGALAQPDVLRGILSQRLVGQACTDCTGGALATQQQCPRCQGSGQQGRRLVVEYLPMSDTLREGMLNDDLLTARQRLKAQGWQSLTEQLQGDIGLGATAATAVAVVANQETEALCYES